MITWRRGGMPSSDERMARATDAAPDSPAMQRAAPEMSSMRPLPVPARTIKRRADTVRDKAPDPDLEPGTSE